MRNFIMFITAVCVLFWIIRISYDGPRTNVFIIHYIISILHCLTGADRLLCLIIL